ncbi:MAG: LPXTG cell wall anchor domain-containing protein [Renibacterium sp.]|nr:LPXTG cell wall anchor domain-containing protein [Renibacterium sp.]
MNLNRLQIQNSKISDVSALAGLSKLTVAVLELNQISDFSPLKNIVDRKGRVRAGGQFVDLPAINVGATQANPVKGPNGELPRTYLSPDARGSVAADGSSWSFSKATTANQITWDFENLPYSREVFDVVGAFTQASLPVSSTVKDDSASTGYQTPVTIDVLANDGLPEESPLDPRSLGFLDSNGQPASTLNLPAGTFDIIDGKIRFTPATGFSGTVPAVEYQARNFDGILSTAKITVTVGPAPAGITPVTPPVAVPDPVQPAGHLTAVDNQTKPSAQAELANTGATTSAPLALAGLLLLAGIAVVLGSRRQAA